MSVGTQRGERYGRGNGELADAAEMDMERQALNRFILDPPQLRGASTTGGLGFGKVGRYVLKKGSHGPEPKS